MEQSSPVGVLSKSRAKRAVPQYDGARVKEDERGIKPLHQYLSIFYV